MRQTCIACQAHFFLSQKALGLLKKFPDEPLPRLCFACGQKRRMSFRNGRKLYRRTCDATGDSIISTFAPEKPYKVYRADVWWGDSWDPRSYGKSIDWNRPFFEQFRALQLDVPRIALTNIKAENSEYCNMSEGNRNCYLIFGGDFNEDCMYGTFGMHNKTILDSDTSNKNERCYFLGDSYHCYDTRYAFDSQNCSQCAFISDCIGCTDCILCTNLTKKSYCIRNIQLSRTEYEEQKRKILSAGSASLYQGLWNEFLALRQKRIVKAGHILSSESCTGDYIQGSKGCENCYDTWDSEDAVDVILAYTLKDTLMSGCIGHQSQLCYDMQATIRCYQCRHSFSIFDSSDIEYSDFVYQSHHLFGCCGMKKAGYCILNTQYTKDEYETLRTRLMHHMQETGEWGQFFPPSCSCFAYNESTAPSYFPLTKAAALAEGFTWFDKEDEMPAIMRRVQANELPDTIDDIPDDILYWAIVCSVSAKPFKIVKSELEFYRSMRLPIPRLHPDERYKQRLSLRNPIRLYKRSCSMCQKEIQTSYSPACLEQVLCEECYLKAVY